MPGRSQGAASTGGTVNSSPGAGTTGLSLFTTYTFGAVDLDGLGNTGDISFTVNYAAISPSSSIEISGSGAGFGVDDANYNAGEQFQFSVSGVSVSNLSAPGVGTATFDGFNAVRFAGLFANTKIRLDPVGTIFNTSGPTMFTSLPGGPLLDPILRYDGTSVGGGFGSIVGEIDGWNLEFTTTFTTASVPEPSSLMLLSLISVPLLRRRQRQA